MSQHKLSEFLPRELEPAHFDRQWERIINRRRERAQQRQGMRRSALGISIAAVVLVGAGALWQIRARSAWEGTAIQTGAHPQSLKLRDGSEVRLARDSGLQVCDARRDDVCLRVEHGSAEFDVQRASRMFRVRAGEVTVSVVGTRFTVEHQVDEAGDHVRVGVTRGIVEVSATNLKPRRLQAGERWSMGWQLETARPKTEHPTAAELPALPTATSVEAEAPEAAAHAASSASNASHQPETAALLWEAAISDRRRGDSVEEARKYEEILSRFPSDTRAGYAAFELGRVRMDAFKDYAGAIPPLRRAVKMGSGTTFHEHALARLCQSHGFLSQSAACEQTRAQYLDQYPNGAHAHAVASACGKR